MRARIDDITINYAVSGKENAPPVVLHHPLATDLTIWDELTSALEPSYRVIRFDARGHGATDAPAGAYDMSRLARDTIGLMDHLGIAKARYLGLSMGGFVGQVLGLEHAKRFHSLTLVSTSSDMSVTREVWEGRIKTASKDGMTTALVEGSLQRWLSETSRKSQPVLVTRLSRMVANTPPMGFVGWCHAIVNFNVMSRLKEIDLPVRIIAGGIDPATTPEMMKIMHREIRGSEYAEVPGTAHMLHVEDPAGFHAQVLPFLAKHGPK